MGRASANSDTVRAAARLTGLSSVAVARLIQAGQIPGIRKGGTIFFSRLPSKDRPL